MTTFLLCVIIAILCPALIVGVVLLAGGAVVVVGGGIIACLGAVFAWPVCVAAGLLDKHKVDPKSRLHFYSLILAFGVNLGWLGFLSYIFNIH